ncbi:FYVE zinc finger [Ostertagia ostertagi]
METVPDMDALLDELEEAVVGNRRKESKIPENNANQAVVIELPIHLRKLSEKIVRMETVPDMDALLDELEEAVVGNRRKESKIPENNANQAVVIELPIHLRKLSEKETIRIELKPPDPVLASLGEHSTTDSVALVSDGGLNVSGVCDRTLPTPSTHLEDSQSHGKSDIDDEVHVCDSDGDTEFEEVLQYLNQFEDKSSNVVDDEDANAVSITSANVQEMQGCSTSAGVPKEEETITCSEIKVESAQNGGLRKSSLGIAEKTQDSDDEYQRIAVGVVEAVVDAILDEVEANIDGISSRNQKSEISKTDWNRNSEDVANSLETIVVRGNCSSDKQAVQDSCVADVQGDEGAPLHASSKESVASGSTDSASFVTVIHRPATESSEQQTRALEEEHTQKDEDQPCKIGKVTEDKMQRMHFKTACAHTNIQAEAQERQQIPENFMSLELSPKHDQGQVKDDFPSVELPRGESHEHDVIESDPSALINADQEEISTGDKLVEDITQKSDHLSDHTQEESSLENDSSEGIRSERAGSEESTHGLETAIECEAKEDDCPSPIGPRDRFGAQVISTIHDLSQDTDPTRLTESELQLGKSKPYWIPDDDCSMCMLCNSRFSLLNRRHHCRACGRVACGSCCKEKATLEYMKDDPKKQAQARVCTPCATMLARIEDYEKMMREHADVTISDETPASTSTSAGSRVSRGVLKTRTTSLGDSEAETSQPSDSSEKKRCVVFRDGVKPGASSPSGEVDLSTEEKSSAVKPKKRSRKRHAVARRVAELRLEDELGCALPNGTRSQLLVVCPNGEMNTVEEEWVNNRLKEEFPVTVVLKKNLSCVVKICKVNSMSVFCVHSCGFATIGLDEVLFVWKRENPNDFSLPLNVLHRIAQIFSTSCDADQAGVRQVCSRLPSIHSVPIAVPPLSRHILFFHPTLQDFSSLSLPNSPFLVALFLNDAEVPWAMACPNRLLFRLGLKYSWYPTPFVNIVGRQAVYSTETSQTVLKVFTDFRSWSFRMKHLAGSTVTLSNDVTLVEIPKSAKDDLEEIVSFNCKMLAWSTSTNLTADSHLVCDETDGVYSTQVLARGSSRKATGASFLIIDGGLKTNGLQISVVEDGVAIRIPSERLESLLQALNATENWTTSDASGTHFVVRWTDGAGPPSPFGPVSPIDGQTLANKFQYGLSLERAISSVLQVNSVSDYGVRLSHVYNLKDGRLAPDDEPKVFSIAEMLARECTGMLEPYLTMLINMGIMSISVRVGVSADTVEYDVSPWFGMEEEQLLYKQNMDQLIPVLYDILGYLSGGFHIELVLSFVSTKTTSIHAGDVILVHI